MVYKNKTYWIQQKHWSTPQSEQICSHMWIRHHHCHEYWSQMIDGEKASLWLFQVLRGWMGGPASHFGREMGWEVTSVYSIGVAVYGVAAFWPSLDPAWHPFSYLLSLWNYLRWEFDSNDSDSLQKFAFFADLRVTHVKRLKSTQVMVTLT